MKFTEALQELEKGNKIRYKDWPVNQWLGKDGKQVYWFEERLNRDGPITKREYNSLWDISGDNWELVQETYTFTEALNKLGPNDIIYRKSVGKDFYISLVQDAIHSVGFVWGKQMLNATDWMVEEKPVKKDLADHINEFFDENNKNRKIKAEIKDILEKIPSFGAFECSSVISKLADKIKNL